MNVSAIIMLPVEFSRLLAGKSFYNNTLQSTRAEYFTLKGITKYYEDAHLHRLGQNKPNQTQFQTQANGFFKILPRLPIITHILPGHWPARPIIQPAKDAELLTVLVNLPLNPADKTNWNRPQAQNAQPFLLKNAETRGLQKGQIHKRTD